MVRLSDPRPWATSKTTPVISGCSSSILIKSSPSLKSGLISYRIGGPRPIDEKKLDFQTAFLEIGTGDDRNWIKLRAGRHEMEYGSGRLIDVREGPNVRLSFDGFKVKTGIGSWQIDAFAMRPDLDKPGFFNNVPNHSVGFWGVYGVRPLTKNITLDTTTLASTEKLPHSTEALPTKCITASVRVCLDPSLKRNLVGISTMRRLGNLEASVPQISAHGLWRRRRVTGSRPFH
jgi:hypothetical protein